MTHPARGEEPAVYFDSAEDFRAWLAANHDSVSELWVGLYKKGSPRAGLRYEQAVEEALCFGWIDGLTRGRNADSFVQRFTPRRPGSNWSAVNIAKVAELRQQGRMQPAGLRVFEARDRRRDGRTLADLPSELPPAMVKVLRQDAAAWRHWQAETPSYRRGAVRWVLDAKRDETRERRLATLVEDSAAGQRVKPFRDNDEAPRSI